jgi:hypothetical protein
LWDLWDLAPRSDYYQSVEGDDLSLLVVIEDVLLAFPTYGYRRGAGTLPITNVYCA